MIQRLMNIDRRIIFIFVFIGVAAPLLINVYLPIKPTGDVVAVYEQLEKVAAEGSRTTQFLIWSEHCARNAAHGPCHIAALF